MGCEGGRWSMLLNNAGWQVVCLDVDADTLALCARRIPEATCVLVEPSDTEIPVDSGAARLLLVSEVAPVSQSNWFPNEAGRVVEPGGILICTFYNPTSLRGMAYRTLRRIEAWRHRSGAHFHEHFYGGASYARFREKLESQGFRLLHEEGLCWFPFSRQSNSGLVPLCTRLEGLLGLRRLVTFSPFVIAIARKGGDD
ncbi:MAG: methyltransferase domain-containing protein [Gammaproteobacteria bacterium]